MITSPYDYMNEINDYVSKEEKEEASHSLYDCMTLMISSQLGDYVLSDYPLPSSQLSESLQLLHKKNILLFSDYINNIEHGQEGMMSLSFFSSFV